ncbi:hypothetical protein MNBD_NITROSPINAE02-804 [hydrothermal vent metagenome]|uniref:HTH cro/C1-type domain-containing protein n=1 Tax=hydrothermal vent metagenome TaxID=652676 RepID=A0A3B1C0W2_9ZZZZ
MSEKSVINRMALAGRIHKIRGNKTLHQFAEVIGVSHTSVKRYEEGALPDIDVLLRIAAYAKIDLGLLLIGKPLPSDVRDYRPLRFQIQKARSYGEGLGEEEGVDAGPEDSHYISVPLTEGKIAAGEPIIVDENVIDHILLHLRVLKQTGASRNLAACRVEGDSMAPHLNSGDIVVIDRDADKEKIIERKTYAVLNGDGVTAKMLQKEGYHLYLIPLNPAHRIQHVDLREKPSPIVGLVIGAWRNFEGRII